MVDDAPSVEVGLRAARVHLHLWVAAPNCEALSKRNLQESEVPY